MRILIPILGFAPEGGYRVLSELANAWIRHGHECSFLVPATAHAPYFPTSAEILRADKSGIVKSARQAQKASGMDSLLSLFRGLNEIGKEFDVILANQNLTAWVVRLCKAGRARKFYYVQAYEPGYHPFYRQPVKFTLASASYLLNLKQIANATTYSAAGLKPLDVIPPGIDLSVFVPKPNPGIFNSKDRIILGTIGRIQPYKGTSTALGAFRLLRESDKRLRMHVGFGNVDQSDDITIVPISGDHELAAFYRSIDILIVSCTGQHGAPHYPLIEAMASGTPVVHTGYFPGTAENSWEAPDPSTNAVAETIRNVLNSTDEQRSIRANAARACVASALGWDGIANRFLDHFNA